jgi:hypothetical protein
MADKILWPFGLADHLKPAFAATLAVTIENRKTILEPAILTGDMTLDITIDPELEDAELLVVIKATANADDVTFGNGIDAPVLVGVAGKTKVQKFQLVGGKFIPEGAPYQID